ncbi:bromodomain-containing 8-like protein [Sarcoptes scabiei]|uniref:Bromodomain-containing 8-like protein n=1 Tax=Sarcoptes scabiei TaxID=52283 RepID=A0A132A1Y1_SARSC|nr:bromodomain-containing 8-like protein [Sarcoptes scabiei]
MNRLRLKQEPVDDWSNREKLALAICVQKLGNQNWGPIVRLLKANFSESNRPTNWFMPKFCALQYNDMLDKIEVPKRKRGERGEDTTQDLIVKHYTNKRLEELETSLKKKFHEIVEVDKTLKILKSRRYDEEFFVKIREEIKEDERKKIENQIALETQLKDREIKLAQISAKFRNSLKPMKIDSPLKDITKETIDVRADKESSAATSIIERRVDECPNEKYKDVEMKVGEMKSEDHTPTVVNVELNEEVSLQTPSKNDEQLIYPKDPSESVTETSDLEVETITDETEIAVPQEIIEQESSRVDETATIESEEVFVKNEAAVPDEKVISNNLLPENIANDEEKSKQETENIGPDLEEKIEEKIKIEQDESLLIENDDSVKVEAFKDFTKIESEDIKDEAITEDELTQPEKTIRRKRKRSNPTSTTIIQTRSTRSSFVNSNAIVQLPLETIEVQPVIVKEEIRSNVSKKKINVNIIEEKNIESNAVGDSSEKESSDAPSPMDSIYIKTSDITDTDTKWRRKSLLLLKNIQNHQSFPLISKLNQDSEIFNAIHKKITLDTIRNSIHNNQIRTNDELKRDLMILFTNSVLINKNKSEKQQLIKFSKESLNLFETTIEMKSKNREKSYTPEIFNSTLLFIDRT